MLYKSVLLFSFAIPGTLTAQSLRLSALAERPSIQVTLGPLALRATFGVRAPAHAPRGGSRPTGSSAATASARRVLAAAARYVGIRYRYGGASPAEGFDCSGLVQYVFGRSGVALPRTSRQQATAGRRVTGGVAALRPGDLMLFASRPGGPIDHVAIYAGGGRIIHSSPGLGGVGYDDLSSPRGEWFLRRHVASRRVLSA